MPAMLMSDRHRRIKTGSTFFSSSIILSTFPPYGSTRVPIRESARAATKTLGETVGPAITARGGSALTMYACEAPNRACQ